MLNKVVVSRIQTLDRTQIFDDQEELESFLKTISDDTMLSVEFKLNLPKPGVTSVFNQAYRLQGAKNWNPVKEDKTLVTWENFSKLGLTATKIKIGAVIEGATIKESYVPITQLNDKFGLDANGNVTDIPVLIPDTNQVCLFSVSTDQGVEFMPMFRKLEFAEGIVIPFKNPDYEKGQFYSKVFTGVKKLPNGKKTPEYQDYLNEMYATYATPEDMVETTVDEFSFKAN